jgi:hypothetical protein
MADVDIIGTNSDLPVGITGLNLSGVPTFPVNADSTGRLLTNNYSPAQTFTGTISALNGFVTANGLTFQNYTILVTGTWSGTLITQKSVDGVNWVTVPCYDMAQGYIYAAIVGNNTVIVPAGTNYFRVYMSTYTSGTANVTIIGTYVNTLVEVIQPSGASLQTVAKISDASGNPLYSTSNALNTYITNPSIPVTGTFWQTTQPISGTINAQTQDGLGNNITSTTSNTINSGTKTSLDVSLNGNNTNEIVYLLNAILLEIKKTNFHLATITENEIADEFNLGE